MTQGLPHEFEGSGEVKGYYFQLVAVHTDIGYIYMVSNDADIHYEVFMHKETSVLIDFEKRIYSEEDTKVRYPKANDFGVWAWTYNNHKSAQNKMDELVKLALEKEGK